MFRTRIGSLSSTWEDRDFEQTHRGVLVQCAIARSVLGAALSNAVPVEPDCEESLIVVERWCQGTATASDVRTAAREVMLRRLDVNDETGARGAWRRRICDAVLRACEEARDALDSNPLERASQMSLV